MLRPATPGPPLADVRPQPPRRLEGRRVSPGAERFSVSDCSLPGLRLFVQELGAAPRGELIFDVRPHRVYTAGVPTSVKSFGWFGSSLGWKFFFSHRTISTHDSRAAATALPRHGHCSLLAPLLHFVRAPTRKVSRRRAARARPTLRARHGGLRVREPSELPERPRSLLLQDRHWCLESARGSAEHARQPGSCCGAAARHPQVATSTRRARRAVRSAGQRSQ